MKGYFVLSIKHDIKPEMIYCIKRMHPNTEFYEGVLYIVSSKLLPKAQVLEAIKKNKYLGQDMTTLVQAIDKLDW